jgi:hypothetical protein
MATFLDTAVSGAAGLQGLKSNQMQMDAYKQQQADTTEASNALRDYYKTGNQESLINATMKSPQLAQQVLQSVGIDSQQKQQRAAQDVAELWQLSDNPDAFKQRGLQRVESIMQSGGNPSDTIALLQTYDKDPQQAKQMLRSIGAGLEATGFKTGIFAEKPEGITPYQEAQLGLREREVAAAEKRAGRPDTQVTIDNKQDTEIAKLSAKDYQTIIGNASKANKEIATIGTLEKLSEKAFSGTGAGALLAGAKLLDQAGIKTEGLTESEVYEKVANTLVLDKSQQMAGALSNGDMAFLQNTVPGLNTSKESRKLTFDIGKKLAQREKDVAKLATEFRKANGGSFDSGEFQIYLDEWKEANPLFEAPKAEQQSQPQMQALAQAIEYLRQNPQLKEQFRAKYGYLPEGL